MLLMLWMLRVDAGDEERGEAAAEAEEKDGVYDRWLLWYGCREEKGFVVVEVS